MSPARLPASALPHHHHKHKAPNHKHGEHHFRASALVRDIVIGMADGLTVPFALAAGLAGATDAARIVVTAGLAEIAAGAIAMGLGGYLAARTDAEHYASEYARELSETVELPIEERAEVEEIFRRQGLEGDALTKVTDAVTGEQKRWVEFMMRYELGLEEPDPARALTSASAIGLSYIAGGMIPLAPYIMFADINRALHASIALTLVALFGFGYGKASLTGSRPLKGGLQTFTVGGLAAAAVYFIAGLVR